MMKTNNELNKALKDSGSAVELEADERVSTTEKMKKWVGLNAGRVVIGLTSATVFFVAKQYSKS
jgi:hypothetical protein